MIKWRMPLKCDFITRTNSHLCRQVALFQKFVTTVIEHHYARRTANIALSVVWCMSVPIPHPDKLSLEQ